MVDMETTFDTLSKHRDLEPIINTEMSFQSSRPLEEPSFKLPVNDTDISVDITIKGETTSGYSSTQESPSSSENSPRKSDAEESPRRPGEMLHYYC